jgi:hypothetical protein
MESIKRILGDRLEIIWEPEKELALHPNGLTFYAGNGTSPGTYL